MELESTKQQGENETWEVVVGNPLYSSQALIVYSNT